MGDRLLPLPLTERSVHLCVDMQRIFSATVADGLDGQGLASRGGAREPSSRENRFHPLHSPERPEEMPGMWQRYYTRWRVATRERLDLQLLELMPPLAALCPPATVIDKTRYSAFAEPRLIEHCANARRTR